MAGRKKAIKRAAKSVEKSKNSKRTRSTDKVSSSESKVEVSSVSSGNGTLETSTSFTSPIYSSSTATNGFAPTTATATTSSTAATQYTTTPNNSTTTTTSTSSTANYSSSAATTTSPTKANGSPSTRSDSTSLVICSPSTATGSTSPATGSSSTATSSSSTATDFPTIVIHSSTITDFPVEGLSPSRTSSILSPSPSSNPPTSTNLLNLSYSLMLPQHGPRHGSFDNGRCRQRPLSPVINLGPMIPFALRAPTSTPSPTSFALQTQTRTPTPSSSALQTLTSTTCPIFRANLNPPSLSRDEEGIPNIQTNEESTAAGEPDVDNATVNANSSNNSSSGPPDLIPEPHQNGIVSADLVKLISEAADTSRPIDDYSEQKKTVILLDCRIKDNYSKKRIKFVNVVNIPPFVFDNDVNQEFTSKAAVIKLVQQACPDLLEKLHEPGYYGHIVLLDETSTTNLTSPCLKILRLAMIKWNETKKTSIKLLQGGIWAFSKQFPDMILPKPALPLTPLFAHIAAAHKAQNAMKNASADAKILMQGFQTHLENLDEAINATKTIILLRQIRKSLDSVKNVLLQEEELKVLKLLEAQIPDEVKCPICVETYSGIIIQCGNGHCICETCVSKMTSCPECRLAYAPNEMNAGKVRNRVLENLLTNSLRCNCSCGEVLMCKDAQTHAKICAYKRKSEDVGKIEAQINLKEKKIKNLNLELEQVNKRIVGSEQRWNNRLGSRGQDMVPTEECKKIMEKIYCRKIMLSSSNKSLLASIFL